MSMTVRQPRVVQYLPDSDVNFHGYLSDNDYDIDNRAYIMHCGKNIISPVNENFVRLSIPYKRAKSGYGVVILPKDQVILSNMKTYIDRHDMYDVDLGDVSKKLTVDYIDENGNKCSRLESVRYIERYMNFTQSAYYQGAHYQGYGNKTVSEWCATRDIKDVYHRYLKCKGIGKFSDGRDLTDDQKRAVKTLGLVAFLGNVWDRANYSSPCTSDDVAHNATLCKSLLEQYTVNGELDIRKFDDDLKFASNVIKQDIMVDPYLFSCVQFGYADDVGVYGHSPLQRNLAPMFVNSFVDGRLKYFRVANLNIFSHFGKLYDVEKTIYAEYNRQSVSAKGVQCQEWLQKSLKCNTADRGVPLASSVTPDFVPEDDSLPF